jgi:hypothetical protein
VTREEAFNPDYDKLLRNMPKADQVENMRRAFDANVKIRQYLPWRSDRLVLE